MVRHHSHPGVTRPSNTPLKSNNSLIKPAVTAHPCRPVRCRPVRCRRVAATTAAVLILTAGGCGYRSSSQPQVSDKGATAEEVAFQFKTLPRTPAAGVPCIWDMKVLDMATGKGLKSFSDRDGQRLRLAVLSENGRSFQLVQPDYKDYGHFVMQGTFAVPGPHRIFAFFTPFGGKPLVKGFQYSVGSKAAPPVMTPLPDPPPPKPSEAQRKAAVRAKNVLPPLPIPASLASSEGKAETVRRGEGPENAGAGVMEKTVDGLRIALQSSSPVAGQDTNLTLMVRNASGGPVPDLQPVLGAPAQLVAISADQTQALAPEMLAGTGHNGAPSVFRARFPMAGPYLLWAQVARGGKTLTVPFTLRIAGADKAGAATSAAPAGAGAGTGGEKKNG